jgi:AraC-like DNA-binding protein
MTGTLSVVVVRAVVSMLEGAGIEARSLLEEHGLPPELLEDPDARIPAETAFRLVERMPELLGDELFCLRAARFVPDGALDVFDFAIRASATMGEALERCVRYYALLDDRTELRLERRAAVARVVGKNRSMPPAPRPATELLFGMLLARGEQLTGKPCPLLEVRFLQTPPRDPPAYQEFFGVPVQFSQDRDELVFQAEWLDEPCSAYDPALAQFFDRYARAYLARLAGPASFVDSVRQAITEGLRAGEPTLASTARALATSERTLQRRLREASSSYAELVDGVRRELALDFLRDPALPIAEVGYLLGFSDTSAFYRAFKRWTGSTPADHRKQPSLRVRGR